MLHEAEQLSPSEQLQTTTQCMPAVSVHAEGTHVFTLCLDLF